jgi:hypothetical protein
MTEAALATMGAGSAFAFSSRRNVIYGCRRRRPPVLTSTNRIVREANPNVAGDNLACRWGFSTAQGHRSGRDRNCRESCAHEVRLYPIRRPFDQ